VWFWIGLLKFLIPTVLIKDIRKTEKERLHQTNVRLNLELLRAVFQRDKAWNQAWQDEINQISKQCETSITRMDGNDYY
jgi:hypothetical protein